MPDSSPINIGGLTEPVTVLIKKISNAVGTLWEPRQIRRVAQAEADAALILAKGEIQIKGVQWRAARRFVEEETRKQLNMEKIVEKAIQDVDPNAPTEDVEEDWIANFFDKCRSFSDDEMQVLWSRILSGEANSPGSFSRKTVNLVADLDKASAELFHSLCSFGWRFGDELVPLIVELSDAIYAQHGINLLSLSHLDSIGLVQINGTGGFRLRNQPKERVVSYQRRSVILRFPRENQNDLKIGNVLLTPSGMQLSDVVKPRPVDGFFEFIYDRWVAESLVAPRRDQTLE